MFARKLISRRPCRPIVVWHVPEYTRPPHNPRWPQQKFILPLDEVNPSPTVATNPKALYNPKPLRPYNPKAL